MSTSVVHIHADALVADAAELMEEHHLRRLPVIDEDGYLIGIITDADVLEAETAQGVFSSLEPGVEGEWLTVGEVMTRDVITVTPEATVGQLVMLMLEHKIGGFPVVRMTDGHHRHLELLGIVTETDIFQMIADAWHDHEVAQA
jgi:acetoin utilization protein AcuB